MPAPAGAFSIFPHCRSSARSSRSLFYTSPLPQQCPLQQEPFLYFPAAAAVPAPAGALSTFPHCRSSIYPHLLHPPTLPQQYTLQQKPLLPSRRSSITTSGVQHPISPKPCNFLGGLLATIWLLSHDKYFGELSGSGLNAELGPLSPGEGSTPGSGTFTELGALSSDSTPNTHNHLFSLLYVSVNS